MKKKTSNPFDSGTNLADAYDSLVKYIPELSDQAKSIVEEQYIGIYSSVDSFVESEIEDFALNYGHEIPLEEMRDELVNRYVFVPDYRKRGRQSMGVHVFSEW